MAERCRRCGQFLPHDARFCPSCGLAVETSSSAVVQRHHRLSQEAPASLASKARNSLLKGERRPVTALFADIVGSTAILEEEDPEDWTGMLNEAFSLMSKAVYRYEGTIAHLLGDGLLAFFGTPVAHEDDPERAVRASIEIMRSLDPFSADLAQRSGVDFKVRIGINTGLVVVGDVGSDLRYEYTAIGDAVNVAARVQAEAAPSSILVTQATHRFIAPKFETLEMGELSLKGKSEPVLAYEVIGEKAVPEPSRGLAGFPSPLIGRDVPLARMVTVLEATASDRKARSMMLVGEPGIGKSRLLNEFRAGQKEKKMVWADGKCLSFGRNLANHLIIELLRSLLGVSASTSPHDAARALAAGLGGSQGAAPREESFQYLAHLLELHSVDSKAIEVTTRDVQRERMLAAVVDLVDNFSKQGVVVLACEDVHWADPASVDMLQALMPALADLAVLLLLTSRPDAESPMVQLAESGALLGDHFERIDLAPLSETESRNLVAGLLEIESLAPHVRQLILGKSEGNPLFVEEVVRMLLEQNAIVRTGDRWVAAQVQHEITLPDNIQGLLLARIDRLPDEPRTIARIASVVGREFNEELLSGVAETILGTATDVTGHLRELETFDLVRRRSGARQDFAFRHALIQDAVYESILQRDKRRLHLAVAQTLERMYSQRLEENAAILAMHLERSGEIEKAVDYLVAAGEHALNRFAPKESYELFDRALAHLSSMPRSKEVLEKRVRAGLGRSSAGGTFIPGSQEIAELEELVPDAEELGIQELLAEIHIALSAAHYLRGEIPQVSPAMASSLEAAERIAESLNDDRLRALPMSIRAFSHFAAAEFRRAVEILEKAVPLLERYATLSQAAFSAGVAAMSLGRMGRFSEAERWLDKGASLAVKSGDPNAILDADLHRAVVEGDRGNLETAMHFTTRALEIAEAIDNKACALVGHFMVGAQHLRMGDAQTALSSLERSAEISQYCNVADVENLSRAWLSAARSQLGDREDAIQGIEESLVKAREMGDKLGEAEILRQRAIVRARLEDPDWRAINTDFEAAIAIFEKLEALPYLARALRDFAMTLQAGGKMEEGRERLRRAMDLFERLQITTPH